MPPSTHLPSRYGHCYTLVISLLGWRVWLPVLWQLALKLVGYDSSCGWSTHWVTCSPILGRVCCPFSWWRRKVPYTGFLRGGYIPLLVGLGWTWVGPFAHLGRVGIPSWGWMIGPWALVLWCGPICRVLGIVWMLLHWRLGCGIGI